MNHYHDNPLAYYRHKRKEFLRRTAPRSDKCRFRRRPLSLPARTFCTPGYAGTVDEKGMRRREDRALRAAGQEPLPWDWQTRRQLREEEQRERERGTGR